MKKKRREKGRESERTPAEFAAATAAWSATCATTSGRTTHAERGEKERRDSGRNRVSGQGKIFGRIELNDEKNFEKLFLACDLIGKFSGCYTMALNRAVTTCRLPLKTVGKGDIQ